MTEKMPDEIYAWRGYQDNGSWETSDVVDGVTPTDGVYYVRKDLMPQWNEDMESAPTGDCEFAMFGLWVVNNRTGRRHWEQYYLCHDESGCLRDQYDDYFTEWELDSFEAYMIIPTPPQSGEKEGV